MTGLLARANARLTLWLARIAAVALAAIAAMTFCDVIGRYVFNKPFTGTVEMTEMAMALVVYLGVGLVTHEGSHINADFVVLRLRPRRRALLALVTNILALGFLAVMVWRLWVRASFLFAKGDTTPVWIVPLWPIAFAIAIGSVFLLSGVLLQLIAVWHDIEHPQQRPAPPPAAQPYRE